MQTLALGPSRRSGLVDEFMLRAMQVLLHPLRVLMAAPSFLFLATLTAMLLRHPDVAFYEIDRVAFVLLVVGVV